MHASRSEISDASNVPNKYSLSETMLCPENLAVHEINVNSESAISASSDIIYMHDKIKNFGTNNFNGCKIVLNSKLNIAFWERELQLYDN